MINLPKKLLVSLAISLGLLVAGAAGAQAATFSLSPASGSTVSGTFNVTLSMTSLGAGKQVSGIDAYLNYEPSKLEAQSISVSSAIFSESGYSVKTIDSTNGLIAISAGASAFEPVTSGGKIATITFRALAASGSTTLSFDYTAGSTTDSNIVDSNTGEELLTTPPTVTYNFGTSITPPTPTPTPSPTPTPTPAPTPAPAGNGTPKGGTPKGGVTEPTVLVSFLSMVMVGAGLALRRKSPLTKLV